MKSLCFDREGKPITVEEFARLFEDKDYKVLARTRLPGGLMVSTVWLGIDHGPFGDLPVIFETMIFGPEDDSRSDSQWRYCTEAEALAGHDKVIASIVAEMQS